MRRRLVRRHQSTDGTLWHLPGQLRRAHLNFLNEKLVEFTAFLCLHNKVLGEQIFNVIVFFFILLQSTAFLFHSTVNTNYTQDTLIKYSQQPKIIYYSIVRESLYYYYHIHCITEIDLLKKKFCSDLNFFLYCFY